MSDYKNYYFQDEKKKELVDLKEQADRINNVATAKDDAELVDAIVDFFGNVKYYMPQLWGPNGDKAKEAIKGALTDQIGHRNAVERAVDKMHKSINGDNGNPANPDGSNPADPNNPRTSGSPTPYTPSSATPIPVRRDPLVLDLNHARVAWTEEK